MPNDLKLDLLLKIETSSEKQETLITVVMDAAIKAVDSFLKMVNLCERSNNCHSVLVLIVVLCSSLLIS